ncbi:hypothetical protein N7497_012377 [Penicillium chrysogenum]|nr:hypothetical protein N7497_012377 [Penicillium chrysogenum]
MHSHLHTSYNAKRYQRAKRNRDEARSNRRRIEEIWAKERELDQGPAVPPAAAANVAAAANTGAAKQ